MKRSLLFLIILFSMFIISCDDSTNNSNNNNNNNTDLPDLSQSMVEASNILFDTESKKFYSDIIVTVKSTSGALLTNKAVTLQSNSSNVTIDPEQVLTDNTGEAHFKVYATDIGNPEISTYISNDENVVQNEENKISENITLDFDFSINLIPLESEYSYNKGIYSLRATFKNSTDSFSDIPISVSDSSMILTFPETDFVTNPSGQFVFTVETSQAGQQNISFTVDSLNSPIVKSFDFSSPTVGGSISLKMTYPMGFESARVAVMPLNLTTSGTYDPLHPLLFEIASESTCPCPGPAEYEINLPIKPEDSLLTDENQSSNSKTGYFALVVYDDLDNNQQWNNEEPIIGIRLSSGILAFTAPIDSNEDIPENAGWHIVNSINDKNTVLDWTQANALDIFVTRSEVYHPHIGGNVQLFDFSPLDSTYKIGWYVVNINQLTDYPSTYIRNFTKSEIEQLLSNSNYVEIFHTDIHSTSTTDGTWYYELDSLENLLSAEELNNIDSWKFLYTDTTGKSVIAYAVVAILYKNNDNDDKFTSGDTIIGDFSSYYGTQLLYVTDYDIYSIFDNPTEIGVHYGYNLITSRLVTEISSKSTSTNYKFYFLPYVYNITSNSLIFNYKIIHSTDSIYGTGVYENTIDISSTSKIYDISIPLTACSGCTSINTGDHIVFYLDSLETILYNDISEFNFYDNFIEN